MQLFKIPKHIWCAVIIPIALIAVGLWRLWPLIEDYRLEEEANAVTGFYHWYPAAWTSTLKIAGQNQQRVVYLQVENRNTANTPHLYLTPIVPQPELPLPEWTQYYGYHFIVVCNPPSSGGKTKPPQYPFLCAFPATYDWRHRRTFITNVSNVMFGVDNGGKQITEWPTESEISNDFRWMSLPANFEEVLKE